MSSLFYFSPLLIQYNIIFDRPVVSNISFPKIFSCNLHMVPFPPAWAAVGVSGCNAQTKEVGVCLHVYLERDFLSLERIVYPRQMDMYR